jgi:chaperonin GroEL (HSP60 family)
MKFAKKETVSTLERNDQQLTTSPTIKIHCPHCDTSIAEYWMVQTRSIDEDMMRNGIIEPFRVQQQPLKSAVESISMILRTDDVVAEAKIAAPQTPSGRPNRYDGMLKY